MPITLTHTVIQQFKNCRRLYYYRNVEQLVPVAEKKPRLLGRAVHKGLETGSIEAALQVFEGIYPSSQEEADQLEIDRATVQAMLEGYFARFNPLRLVGREVRFALPVVNPRTSATSRTFNLAGKADGIVKDDLGTWLVEYKTAGQLGKSYIERLNLDSQITTYVYALRRSGWNTDGVIYRILRKPSIRKTAKESLAQFVNRLIEDYKARPDFYFAEERLYRSTDDLAEFEQELWDLTQDMLKCRREGLWYRNTSRCEDWGTCDYMPLCLGTSGAELWYRKEEPNVELREEEEHAAA